MLLLLYFLARKKKIPIKGVPPLEERKNALESILHENDIFYSLFHEPLGY